MVALIKSWNSLIFQLMVRRPTSTEFFDVLFQCVLAIINMEQATQRILVIF